MGTHKPLEKQGLHGGATSFGESGSSSSGSPGDNSNPLNTKSPNQCQNPNYFNQTQKKKKKKNYRHVSKEQVIQTYQDFISKMKKKGYEVNISEDRFIELSTNP